MDFYYVVTLQAGLAALCWYIVATGAGIAVFSHRIEDTWSERLGLVMVVLTATGAGCRVLKAGETSDGNLLLAFALAFYVCALFWKHWKRAPDGSFDKGTHA